MLDGRLVLTRLMSDNAEQMPGVGMVRPRLQNPPIDALRLRQAPCLVVLQRNGQSGLLSAFRNW